MIDVIGNIIINNITRQKYFDASLYSLTNIECCIDKTIITIDSNLYHGSQMLVNIGESKSNYLMNFEEDHFCVCNEENKLNKLLEICDAYKVDVIKSSFCYIENVSAKNVTGVTFENDLVKIFRMNYDNFMEFQKPYIERYYLGTNCIFQREYAKRFFSQKIAPKPHDYEIRSFFIDYEYMCAVPKFEILRAIDDDHGEPNTCMINNPTQQFLELTTNNK